MIAITIAIATYNRAEEVQLTLQSLTRLKPAGAFEILVVANNCTDRTAEVVAGMIPLFDGKLRLVEEDNQGLSHARNRAVAEAKYPVVAFLDDDVNVNPDWLAAMGARFDSTDVAAVGGQAHLWFPVSRPKWLGAYDEGYLSRVELGDKARPAGSDELFGLNLAFRADWLKRVGAFRTDLGRIGNNLVGGEDGNMLQRVADAGGVLMYEPAAVVEHRVPPARLRRGWFVRRSFDGHVGMAREKTRGELTAYLYAQSLWRTWLAGWGVVAGLCGNGWNSPVTFRAVMLFMGRAGFFVGLLARLSPDSPGDAEREHGDDLSDDALAQPRNG